MKRNVYIPVKVLQQAGAMPGYLENRVLKIPLGGVLHGHLMAIGVMDKQGNIINRFNRDAQSGIKTLEQLHSYGDNLIRLLDNLHYCLRRKLYDTHIYLFTRHSEEMYIKDCRGVVDMDLCRYSAKHFINN